MENLRSHVDSAFSYAPGKAILVGEHAVVYGARAIAMPLLNGVRVAVSKLPSDQKSVGPLIRGMGLFLGDISLNSSSAPPNFLLALEYLVKTFGARTNELFVLVDGSLPPGRGLGSSAALSVALLRGISQYFGEPLSHEMLWEHASALETIFHGRPSGIDHSVVIHGSVIGFQRRDNELKLWPIKVKHPLTFVVGIASPHAGTKNAVARLNDRRMRHERMYARLFDGLDELAGLMEEALTLGRLSQIGELMNMAQGYLNALSVSTAELERLCELARKNGALGAKLTGAGGGGAVIALTENDGHDLANTFRTLGFQSFVTNVSGTAVKNLGESHAY